MASEYIIEYGASVRDRAKKYGISKSTIHIEWFILFLILIAQTYWKDRMSAFLLNKKGNSVKNIQYQVVKREWDAYNYIE